MSDWSGAWGGWGFVVTSFIQPAHYENHRRLKLAGRAHPDGDAAAPHTPLAETCDVVAAPVEEGGDVDDMAMAVG